MKPSVGVVPLFHCLHCGPHLTILQCQESGDILSAEDSGKPLSGRGFASNHARVLTALPRPRTCAPPQEPHRRLRPRFSAIRSCPPITNPGRVLDAAPAFDRISRCSWTQPRGRIANREPANRKGRTRQLKKLSKTIRIIF